MPWNLPPAYSIPDDKSMPPLFSQLIAWDCLTAQEIRSTGDGFFAAARSPWNLPPAYSIPDDKSMPPLFSQLIAWDCLTAQEIRSTGDGFFAAARSMSDILQSRDIATFLNDAGQERRCDLFFDDWYLYAVQSQGSFVYSLFKMREQEYNALHHEIADGDTPGVTISFIALDTPVLTQCLLSPTPQNLFKMREQEYNALHHEIADGDTPGVTISFIALDTPVLTQCLLSPTPQNRTALNREINRVVALRKQTHHPALKAYFLPAEAQGPYLVAQWYVYFLAGLAVDGVLAVPDAYAQLYRQVLRWTGFWPCPMPMPSCTATCPTAVCPGFSTPTTVWQAIPSATIAASS